MIRFLPNGLTLFNLIAGISAIAALFEGLPGTTLVLAALCLLLDIADGYLARRLKVTSELGIQLDSLADMVSFGVLPGMILYHFLCTDCNVSPSISWLPYTAFIVPAGAALRLAKFNLDTREGTVFYGLPTPSAGIMIFGLLWMQTVGHSWWNALCGSGLLYILVLLLPLLMLSNLRLWSLKGFSQKNGGLILLIFIVLLALLLFLTGSAGLPLIVTLYVIFGITNYMLKIY